MDFDGRDDLKSAGLPTQGDPDILKGRKHDSVFGKRSNTGGHAARLQSVRVTRASRTASLVTAALCAASGDHRTLLRFPIRALVLSSTEPWARDYSDVAHSIFCLDPDILGLLLSYGATCGDWDTQGGTTDVEQGGHALVPSIAAMVPERIALRLVRRGQRKYGVQDQPRLMVRMEFCDDTPFAKITSFCSRLIS